MLTRKVLLECMARHETLTIVDIQKADNLGFVPDHQELEILLQQLTENGELLQLYDVLPATYTITEKGMVNAELP